MRRDAIVVGGGHNGLMAAALLARAGRSVLVLERLDHVGGAAVSGSPFDGVEVRLSRYAYLVSLFPSALREELGLGFALRSRPGLAQRSAALVAWQARMARLAERLAPTLIEPLRSREQLRAIVDDERTWEDVFERPLSEALERELESDAERGVVLTDALIGTFASAADPALRQNRCFLYHVIGDGTGLWKVPVGGMGAVSAALAAAAIHEGAEIRTDSEVVSVQSDGRVAEVVCADGQRHEASHLLAGVAPQRLAELLGERSADDGALEGSQLKLNLLLARLPRLRDGAVAAEHAFAGTFHINEGYRQLQNAYEEASAGRIPSVPPCELYCHSLTDPTILSPELRAAGAQTVTVFALHMPARLFASAPAQSKDEAVAATIRSINSVLAEPIEDCLWRTPDGGLCIEARTPPELEAELGMPGGHIFHRDLSWPFAESEETIGRWGVETDRANVWLCGAGAVRGGGVSGIPGHNAAHAVLSAL